jgi:small subunit ribosomal protein S4
MARYIGPKFRLDRREGVNLFLKGTRSLGPKHPLAKKGAVPPGQHGAKGIKRKVSDYGLQLREKQKVRRIYGVLERQFRRYFQEASRKGATGENLLRILETRLDNVVYRLGLAASRSQARQLVSHQHVLVNGKKVNIPSYQVKIGDVVSLSPKASEFGLVKESLKEVKEDQIPSWLERKGLSGRVSKMPAREDIGADIDEQLIVEFYSR